MREVSMRMLHLTTDVARAGGIDEHVLTRGLTSTAARNGASPDWIDWDDFVEVLERLERLLGGPSALDRAVRAAAPVAYPELRALAAIFLHPIPLFRFVMLRFMRTMYRHLEVADIESVSEHTVRWRQTIPEPFRASEAFLRASLSMVELLPTHLDLPEATVEVISLEPRAAEFLATFPPPVPLGTRGARVPSAATAALTAQLDETFARIAISLRARPDARRARVRSENGASARSSKSGADWPTRLELSPRQREVFALLLEGRANKDIALAMGCSERNVEFHVGRILRSARVISRSELLVKVLGSR